MSNPFYNYVDFGSAGSRDINSINQPPTKLQNAGGLRGQPGGPLTDRMPGMANATGFNKAAANETNVAIKATVKTRTRDQRLINQHQLAFMYVKDFDKPVLLSLQQVNQILAGGDPHGVKETTGKNFFSGAKPDPKTWTKGDIKERFKLFGAVVNRDTDLDETVAKERMGRTFTMTVRGDCHILDYWSHNNNRLKRYDTCYFVLKKIWIGPEHKYQVHLNARQHNTGFAASSGHYAWQIIPVSVRDRVIDTSAYTSEIWKVTKQAGRTKKTEDVPPGTPGATPEYVIGSYWRIGNVHEYASIADPGCMKKRDEYSVSRDISYLHDNGMIRPFQFYLDIDDDTRYV